MPQVFYPLSGANTFSRRSFVVASASFATAVVCSSARLFGAITIQPKFSSYPFQLGVASGDPLPDGVVLWTRLAPRPLETGGGMSPESVRVFWQVAEDEGMSRIVRKGEAVANADWAHSVHVEVDGLAPDRWYWYQFKAGDEVSPKGRTRTAPVCCELDKRTWKTEYKTMPYVSRRGAPLNTRATFVVESGRPELNRV